MRRPMRRRLRRAAEVCLRGLRRLLQRLVRRRRYANAIFLPARHDSLATLADPGHPVIEQKGEHFVWLVVACPCRCGATLRLNLMQSQRPATLWGQVFSLHVNRAKSTSSRMTRQKLVDFAACAVFKGPIECAR
jgi:hypothetical protein